ncbi:MAG: hypothetical protein AB7L76_24290, partial [Burkholderiaceae bacterium]
MATLLVALGVVAALLAAIGLPGWVRDAGPQAETLRYFTVFDASAPAAGAAPLPLTRATLKAGTHRLQVTDAAALALQPGEALLLRGRGLASVELSAYDAAGLPLWRLRPGEAIEGGPLLMRNNLGMALMRADRSAAVAALVWRLEAMAGETIALQTLSVAQLQAEVGRQDRLLGLLSATLLLLVGACAVTAWLSGRRLPWYLAACVVTAALVCANAASWDAYALQAWLQPSSIAAWRAIAHSLHLAAVCALFLPLFHEALTHLRFRQGLRLAPMVGLLLALVAPLLHQQGVFLAVFVYCACVAAIALLTATIDILRGARSPRALLFLAALPAQIAGTTGLLLADAGAGPMAGAVGIGGTLLFVVGVSGAVAQAIGTDYQQRERARLNAAHSMRKYRHVYYSAPVALIS